MNDYSMEEKLTEYADSHLTLLLKLDELKEKSRREYSHSLELMKASECKRRYKNLRDDCNAEQFIDVANKTAMSIKNVAKGLSPDSSTT